MELFAKNITTIHYGKQWTIYTKYGALYFGMVKKELKIFKTKKDCKEFIKTYKNGKN
jgi:hypothetical protein